MSNTRMPLITEALELNTEARTAALESNELGAAFDFLAESQILTEANTAAQDVAATLDAVLSDGAVTPDELPKLRAAARGMKQLVSP